MGSKTNSRKTPIPGKLSDTGKAPVSGKATKRLAQLEREIDEILEEDERMRRELRAARTPQPWWLNTGLPATLFLGCLAIGIALFIVTKSPRTGEMFILYAGTPVFLWLVLASSRQPNWRHGPEQQVLLERLAPLYQERNELLRGLEGPSHEDIEPFDDHPELEEATEK